MFSKKACTIKPLLCFCFAGPWCLGDLAEDPPRELGYSKVEWALHQQAHQLGALPHKGHLVNMKMLTIPYLKMIEHGNYHLFWMDLLWEAPMYKVLCNGKENRNVHCSVWRSCYPSAWWPGLKNWIVEPTYNTAVDVWCVMYDVTHFEDATQFPNSLISSLSGWLMPPSPVHFDLIKFQLISLEYTFENGSFLQNLSQHNVFFCLWTRNFAPKILLNPSMSEVLNWASPYQENREPLRAECVLAVKRWGDLSQIRSSFQWAYGPPYW